VLATVISIGSLVAFWSITTWVPQLVRNLGAAESLGTGQIASQVAAATAALNLGGLVSYATWGLIADAVGRKYACLATYEADNLPLPNFPGAAQTFPFQEPGNRPHIG
jgi:MFS family permease